ncbi:HAMP domain-containing protein [Undibacterium sp. LX40W]|uniref:HAMP domain-containing protein n=1 Tax=Undibacterium nitidum TaxID=2762298 RepID=A0A923KSQ1_9BURK|nr:MULTISPECIES: methyl-accepting chemotaxis protein [Undibacterium]MBC3880754.1 HAMP domain-containing protein [Undibacterium nitidum]MBC3890513.1 HAMP domain-containing protein [Undibacterium sp. LX40W]
MKKSKSSQPLILRPGVNLFRQIRFKPKASLISIAFLIPILILLWSFVQTKQESIGATKDELNGFYSVKELIDVNRAAQDYRRAVLLELASGTKSSELANTKTRLETELKEAKAKLVHFNSNEKFVKSLQELEQLYASSAPSSDGLFKVFSSHGKFNHSISRLTSLSADLSGLTLDPEFDTYYLMDLSTNIAPKLIEVTSKMTAIASTVARTEKDGEIASIELSQEEGLIENLLEIFNEEVEKVVGEHKEYADQMKLTELNALLKKFREQIGDDVGKGGVERANAIDKQGAQIVSDLIKVQDYALSQLDSLLQQRLDKLKKKMYATLAAVVFFLFCAFYMFVCFYRVMESGLRHVGNYLDSMAKGDLTNNIDPKGGDEVTALMRSMKLMQDSLLNICTVMRESADQIKGNSAEVAQGSMDMSDRTVQTQNRLQETAATMVQISGTVQSTADNAEQATKLSRENTSLATHGGEVIAEMVTTMEGIRDSSNKIGDIISVIDGIAFQTNILALNAAVEAARAGEAGRGFAVVASEVRALAHRSAEAAKEIKTLITVSVERVEGGNVIVKNAGDAIEKVVRSARDINQLLTEISASAREQSIGVKDVEEVLQELDGMTQANSALVEQTSASAAVLDSLANQLVEEIQVFKLHKH